MRAACPARPTGLGRIIPENLVYVKSTGQKLRGPQPNSSPSSPHHPGSAAAWCSRPRERGFRPFVVQTHLASRDSLRQLPCRSEHLELVKGGSRRPLRQAFGVSSVERSGCLRSPSESKCDGPGGHRRCPLPFCPTRVTIPPDPHPVRRLPQADFQPRLVRQETRQDVRLSLLERGGKA